MKSVLVVGARPNSIGQAVAEAAEAAGYAVKTGGIHEEDLQMDLVSDPLAVLIMEIASFQPTHVVCTVGVNKPEPIAGDMADWYRWHFEANVIGPMRLLQAWGVVIDTDGQSSPYRHFAAISSNSARIPRSKSAAYCASKAALSMALRVKAREGNRGMLVYGYEPGLVRGTPMTADTERRFGEKVPLTRMRDPRLSTGLSASALASLVVHNLGLGPEVNGVLFPLDADEA